LEMLKLKKTFCLVVIFFITTVAFCGQVHASLEMSVPVYGQGQQGQVWAGDQLGTCYPETIGSHGCAITSIAMIFKYYGISTDPRDMNNWLKQNNGYSAGCLVKWEVAPGRSNGSLQYAGRYDYQAVPADLNKINAELNSGYPVIAEVRLSGYMHFVVITGYSGSIYYINDPWYGDSSTINSRYNSNPATAIYGIRVYHGPSNRMPEGYLDHADCNTIGGWARDPDTTNTIRVDLYIDGEAGSGTFLGGTYANIYRSDLPFSDKNHGFNITTPSSLKDGKTHTIYAYAIDSEGGTNPLLSDSPKTITCSSAPSPPSNVQASDGTYTDRVRVTWSASSGATSYEVYRAASSSGTKSKIGIPSGTYYNDASASVGAIYYYWVKAKNAYGTSGYSLCNAGYRAGTAPTAPTGVSATDGTYAYKVRVTWSSVSGATSYTVYRATSSGGTKSTIGSISNTTYDDTSASVGTTYYYWVKASNSYGTSDYSSYNTGSRAGTAPSAPTNVSASDDTYTDRVRVTWNASSGATSYKVYRATSSGGTKTTMGSTSSTTYDDTSASVGTTYFYWVKALNSYGTSDYSSYNTGSRAGTAPSAPTNVSASDGTYTDRVRVTWSASSGATSYKVYRATSSGGTKTTLGSASSTTYDDTSASVGTTYFYWVKASNSYGTSDYSSYNTGSCQGTAAGPPSSITVPSSDRDGSYAVSWELSSTSSVTYVLEEATNASFSNGLRQAYSGSSTSTTITGRSNGSTYYYRVKATRSGYTDSSWRTDSNGCMVTITPPVPPTPGSISYPTSDSDGSYTVSWASSSGVTSYQLERSNNGGSSWSQVYSDSGTFYGESVGNGSYRYRVKATNIAGSSGWRTGISDCIELIVIKGDINGDGNVSLSDAILALQIVIGLNSDSTHLDADVNGDGKIGLEEVIYILQKISGLGE